jgi:hypothetical protein
VKHTPEQVLRIGRDGSGRIIFLERGNERAGFSILSNAIVMTSPALAEGRELAKRLREKLGREYEVLYFNDLDGTIQHVNSGRPSS